MASVHIRPDFCRIASDVQLGPNVRLHAFVNLYGCKVGDESSLGTFVEIQKNASVGARCKISSHTFICEGVHIGNEVFVGHGVMFTNTLLPRATTEKNVLQSEADWDLLETFVRDRVSIGSGSVILCGITIGESSLIGAGSVVTKDVPPGQVWVGNPARFVRALKAGE